MNELYFYKARCTNVVDGDTVDLDIDLGFNIHVNERVRLEGIDTPEVRTSDPLEKEAGILVKSYVKNLIEGKMVYLHSTEFKTGKYGRVIGDIIMKSGDIEVSLCETLITKAYAKEYSSDVDWSSMGLTYITEQLAHLKIEEE